MTHTVTHQTTHALPPAGTQNAVDESHKKASTQDRCTSAASRAATLRGLEGALSMPGRVQNAPCARGRLRLVWAHLLSFERISWRHLRRGQAGRVERAAVSWTIRWGGLGRHVTHESSLVVLYRELGAYPPVAYPPVETAYPPVANTVQTSPSPAIFLQCWQIKEKKPGAAGARPEAGEE